MSITINKPFEGYYFASLNDRLAKERLKEISPNETDVKSESSQLLSISALWDLDDATFKKQIPELITTQQLPFDFRLLAQSEAGDGYNNADGEPLNLLEHSLDVVCGHFGGFGLSTSVAIETLKPAQVKKVLRLAAFFHDSGRTDGRKRDLERSAEIAVQELSKNKDLWALSDEEIGLIKHLILSNDLYGQFLEESSKMCFSELQQKLTIAYSTLQKEYSAMRISEVNFRKLMFALWIADASTLSVVNRERAHHYRSLHQKLDTLNYDKLSQIYLLKNSIIQEKEALPNFSEVSLEIYRGGLPTEQGLEILARMQIKTLVSFRYDENTTRPQEMGFKVFSIPLDAGRPETFTEEAILSFLEVVADKKNRPCFMHCMHGADRTGFMSAVYRRVVEGISQKLSIDELTRFKGSESEYLHPALIEHFKKLDILKLKSN